MKSLVKTLFGIALLVTSTGGYGAFSASAARDGACFSSGSTTYRILPKHAAADYRIRIAEAGAPADLTMNFAQAPEAADFVMLDERGSGAPCNGATETATIALGAKGTADLTIALTNSADADYRIFVRSDNFTPREAAALFAVMMKRARN